jgi:c-di-GMP-binding flagellar brake protein YcgR
MMFHILGGIDLLINSIVKGASMEVEVKCNGKTVCFHGEVAHVIDNSILTAPIKVNDQTIGFSDNCQINFLYVSEGKLYLWENVVVKLVRYDRNIYHKIDLYGEGKQFNRREAYRMYIGEDMPIYVNTVSGPTALSVLVKDISETGVGFITKEDLDLNRTIRMRIKDNATLITISGIIVRKVFQKNISAYLYGCKFNEKNEKLAKFIAKKQSEALRKKTGRIPREDVRNKVLDIV